MLLTSLVLLLTAAPPAQPAAKPTPLTVAVDVAPSAAEAAQTWARELRTALGARKDEFRLVGLREKPHLVVRVVSVVPGPDGKTVLNLALVQDANVRTLVLEYAGAIQPMAEKFARNLRSIAASKSPPAAPTK